MNESNLILGSGNSKNQPGPALFQTPCVEQKIAELSKEALRRLLDAFSVVYHWARHRLQGIVQMPSFDIMGRAYIEMLRLWARLASRMRGELWSTTAAGRNFNWAALWKVAHTNTDPWPLWY